MDSPAAVGQRHGDGAEQQVAFGLADDGLTVGPRADDHKLPQAVPANITRNRKFTGIL